MNKSNPWTQVTPTAPGLYWFHKGKQTSLIILRPHTGFDHGGFYDVFDTMREYSMRSIELDFEDLVDGLFWGPLEPPPALCIHRSQVWDSDDRVWRCDHCRAVIETVHCFLCNGQGRSQLELPESENLRLKKLASKKGRP